MKFLYLIEKKRWIDGSFTDLNPDNVENEHEEYYRELQRILKQFKNLIRKKKLELQAKLMEKKKVNKSKRTLFVNITSVRSWSNKRL
jgi:hypothetical protein